MGPGVAVVPPIFSIFFHTTSLVILRVFGSTLLAILKDEYSSTTSPY
jgi:hypothetical protein